MLLILVPCTLFALFFGNYVIMQRTPFCHESVVIFFFGHVLAPTGFCISLGSRPQGSPAPMTRGNDRALLAARTELARLLVSTVWFGRNGIPCSCGTFCPLFPTLQKFFFFSLAGFE